MQSTLHFIQYALHIVAAVVVLTACMKMGFLGKRIARRCQHDLDKNATEKLTKVLARIEAGAMKIDKITDKNVELTNSSGEKLYICISNPESKSFGWVANAEFKVYNGRVEIYNEFIDMGAVGTTAHTKLQNLLKQHSEKGVQLS